MNNKERHLKVGIMQDLIIEVRERPRHTSLGSTDRKGFTIEIVGVYTPKPKMELNYILEVNAWEKDISEFVERAKEESKHSFANIVYDKFYRI